MRNDVKLAVGRRLRIEQDSVCGEPERGCVRLASRCSRSSTAWSGQVPPEPARSTKPPKPAAIGNMTAKHVCLLEDQVVAPLQRQNGGLARHEQEVVRQGRRGSR